MSLARFFDIMVPRFMTEDVAALAFDCGHCDEPHYAPICSMADVMPGETFDAIIAMRSFNLFGFGLFPRYDVDSVRPWRNPHDKP